MKKSESIIFRRAESLISLGDKILSAQSNGCSCCLKFLCRMITTLSLQLKHPVTPLKGFGKISDKGEVPGQVRGKVNNESYSNVRNCGGIG